MEKITLGLILVFAVFSLRAQSIQFNDIDSLPFNRSGICSATDEHSIYVVNGFGGKYFGNSEVLKYDIKMGTWSVFTESTIPKRYASTAIIEDKLYIFNGDTSEGINDELEIIDLKDQSIRYGQKTPYQTRNGGVATWEDKIYAFGGAIRSKQYSKKVFVYHSKTDQWKYVTDLPIGLETQGEIVAGKLYVIGGYNGGASSKIYIYNLNADKWEQPFEMPAPISAHTTTVDGDKIYLVGDYKNLKHIASFDTKTKEYEVLESNLKPRRHAAVEAIHGKLYIMGGNVRSATNTAMKNVQMAILPSGVSKKKKP